MTNQTQSVTKAQMAARLEEIAAELESMEYAVMRGHGEWATEREPVEGEAYAALTPLAGTVTHKLHWAAGGLRDAIAKMR